ncbi:hypothetical protein MGALJ_19520 [Mycobacterium gallinarum]|uniref:Arsenate reductase n=1 Tax=Mycobacterium gallinarum TaxID=39689 RepID=A0A9W4B944_9MYCO|nr:hypothetical protein [Mycobacterium gallinarum]BBY92283.1 hypothetical protein MGALJ_19520 [Mycobacterium gallinarum]
MTETDDWAPDACTLPTSERPLRVAEFDDLFRLVLRSKRVHLTRLDLCLPADVESAARDLAQRESECCSFFTFDFDLTRDELVMRIEVPTSQADVLDALQVRTTR